MIKVGDTVRHKQLGQIGFVERITGELAEVRDDGDDGRLFVFALSNLELYTGADTVFDLPTGTGALVSEYQAYESDDAEQLRKKRREAGECEECGYRLPMSIWGLGECPHHPKPAGPQ